MSSQVKRHNTKKLLQHGVPQPKKMKQQQKQRECPVGWKGKKRGNGYSTVCRNQTNETTTKTARMPSKCEKHKHGEMVTARCAGTKQIKHEQQQQQQQQTHRQGG
jgi:hypothetical protein